MANTVGGLLVIGVDDGKKDHTHALAPSSRSLPGRGTDPLCPRQLDPTRRPEHVRARPEVRRRRQRVLTVPPSTQMPQHAVAAPGNDYNFRAHVRHGTTTRALVESEIAQRYGDRFHAASAAPDSPLRFARAQAVRHVACVLDGQSERAPFLPAHRYGRSLLFRRAASSGTSAYCEAAERFRIWLAETGPTAAAEPGPDRLDGLPAQSRPVIADTSGEGLELFCTNGW
ncbi:hypothetical protein ACFQ69_35955 [Streptomyces sp. NPDC056470]|uniref:hypothetical protein n=1 Tax=Streptomyces sp. NPDC056470 TaxID=3345831 RepID=UPI0036A1EF34